MSKLVVHQIPGAWGLPSIGPFCLKLETWLKMTGIAYDSVVDATPFKGPKGKLPWIEDGGTRLGDSGLILDYLRAKHGVDPDERLSEDQRAVAHALRRLLEENLYWTLVHDRWMVEKNWPLTQQTVLGLIPSPLRLVVAPVARRGVRSQLRGHGIGRHTAEEIHAIGRRDVAAVGGWLDGKSYLMGDEPTEIDAISYGILANIALVPVESPVKDEILGRANLRGWLDRMRERFYPA